MIYKRADGAEISIKQVPKGRGHVYEVKPLHQLGSLPPTQLPSITTILREADGSAVNPIARWSVKKALEHIAFQQSNQGKTIKESWDGAVLAPSKELELAGNKGTAIHKSFERYLVGGWEKGTVVPKDLDYDEAMWEHNQGVHASHPTYIYIDAMQEGFRRIARWIERQGYELVGTELPVYDHNLQVAGTIDLLLSDKKETLYVCDLKTGTNIYKKDGMQIGAYLGCLVSMMQQGIQLWDGFSDDMPQLDRVKVGGSVIHLRNPEKSKKKYVEGWEKKPKLKIHHLNEDMISNIGFISANALWSLNKKSKFEVERL